MGDALPTVALGTGRTATAITAGDYHACALLDNATVKCWGDNGTGLLGLGDVANRGDSPGEMGDALPAVALGAGRTATAISAGGVHTCALLDNDQAKCWGRNAEGQLGLGDTANRGDSPGEMGDALPAVALGTGRTATAITTSSLHTCALLDNDQAKCWGRNLEGQLGLGDTANRGDGPGEMGDALPAVDLPPGNDDFAVAQALTGASGTVAGSNANADKQPDEPDHDGFAAANSSVWYQWTAPATGSMTIDTFGSTFDTVLAVYTGTAVDDLAPVASNDDTDSLQSRVTFAATAGTTYRIAVAGFNGHSGRIRLNWTLPPANDDFADAAVLTGANGTRQGTNEGAGIEPDEPHHNANGFVTDVASVWYRWRAPAGGRTSFSTVGSGFDTGLAIYTGSTIDDLTPVAANGDIDDDNHQSRVVFTARAGTAYRIAVAGHGWSTLGDHGDVRLAWTQAAACDGRAVTVALAFGDRPTAGNDVVRGTLAGQRINGGNGNDRICGGGGGDTLVGGGGNDRLLGEAGADTLQGGAGSDFLSGGTQRDTCKGGPQRDTQAGCEVRASIP
jgi:Ca2+-binding RTX toxin-like protein